MNIEYIAEKLEDISKALGNIAELDKELALLKKEVEELRAIVDKMPETVEHITTNNQEIDRVFRDRFTNLMKTYLRTKEAQGELEEMIQEKIDANNADRDTARTKENNKLLLKVITGMVVIGTTVLTLLVETGALKITLGG